MGKENKLIIVNNTEDTTEYYIAELGGLINGVYIYHLRHDIEGMSLNAAEQKIKELLGER